MTKELISAAAAGSWELGDLSVNRIGLGAMRLTGDAPFGRGKPSDRDTVLRLLRQALDLGVNHIDTAAFYFSATRSANELINRALSPYPDELVIATKVGPSRDPSGAWLPWATPDQLRWQVEENLRQLGRDNVDLVYLRMYGAESLAEHFGALAELRDAGLIRHLGLSNVRSAQLAEALAIAPVVSVQNRYGIGTCSAEAADVLRTCREMGIAFVPYFTIAGEGREAGPSGVESEELVAVARTHGVTTAQVRLAWTLHHGRHVLAIPGTRDPRHLTANVAAGALRLSPEEFTLLAKI